MNKILFALVPLILCRCTSMGTSIALGAGIGAATGIATSQLANYNTKGHLVLGIGGAVLGGAIGALLHRDTPGTTLSVPPGNILKEGEPPLAGAEKDVILVPDKIEGDQFVEHHRVWTINKPARWELYPGKEGENTDVREEKSNGE